MVCYEQQFRKRNPQAVAGTIAPLPIWLDASTVPDFERIYAPAPAVSFAGQQQAPRGASGNGSSYNISTAAATPSAGVNALLSPRATQAVAIAAPAVQRVNVQPAGAAAATTASGAKPQGFFARLFSNDTAAISTGSTAPPATSGNLNSRGGAAPQAGYTSTAPARAPLGKSFSTSTVQSAVGSISSAPARGAVPAGSARGLAPAPSRQQSGPVGASRAAVQPAAAAGPRFCAGCGSKRPDMGNGTPAPFCVTCGQSFR